MIAPTITKSPIRRRSTRTRSRRTSRITASSANPMTIRPNATCVGANVCSAVAMNRKLHPHSTASSRYGPIQPRVEEAGESHRRIMPPATDTHGTPRTRPTARSGGAVGRTGTKRDELG